MLSASTAGISDANGMVGAIFTYQWQALVGMNWANIGGATGEVSTRTMRTGICKGSQVCLRPSSILRCTRSCTGWST
jgi:hypothetical protein